MRNLRSVIHLNNLNPLNFIEHLTLIVTKFKNITNYRNHDNKLDRNKYLTK